MVANLNLPREAWEAHPKFPQQVLLLGSHESFRSVSHYLIRRAEAGDPRRALLRSFSWWKSGMRGHEYYEESKLYPYLCHRWGLDCSPLEAGHHALAVAEAHVHASADLVEALKAHHDVLLEHLDLEERLVIPALLALNTDEFDAYYHQPLWTTIRETSCHALQCKVCSPGLSQVQ